VKTEGEIKQKVKQVIFRHRKAYIRQGLAKKPLNCRHNDTVRLPVHMSNRAELRVCGFCPDGVTPNNFVCDSTMGGDKQAADCPFFENHTTADELKEEFNKKLGLNGEAPVQIGYIAKEYPDVAALMWVLGPGGREQNPEEPKSEGPNAGKGGGLFAFFGDGEDLESVPERPLVEEATHEPESA